MPAINATILFAATLAQGSAEQDPTRVLIVIGMLIVSVLVLGMVVMQLRKRLLTKDTGADSPGSILEDLRSMRKRGEISESEFQTMRQRIVGKISAASGVGLSDDAPGLAVPITTAPRGVPRRVAPGSGRSPLAENSEGKDSARLRRRTSDGGRPGGEEGSRGRGSSPENDDSKRPES